MANKYLCWGGLCEARTIKVAPGYQHKCYSPALQVQSCNLEVRVNRCTEFVIVRIYSIMFSKSFEYMMGCLWKWDQPVCKECLLDSSNNSTLLGACGERAAPCLCCVALADSYTCSAFDSHLLWGKAGGGAGILGWWRDKAVGVQVWICLYGTNT